MSYPQPYYPPPPAPVIRPTSGLAVASMIAGIFGVLGGWCMFGIPCFAAILLGHAAVRETKSGERGGHGMAIAGLIMGYLLGVPIALFGVMMGLAGFAEALK